MSNLRTLRAGMAHRSIKLGSRLPALPSERERRGFKPTLAFYGSAPWKNLMRSIIAKRGRRCEHPQCRTPNHGQGGRVYGDHVDELRDGGNPLDERNVMLLCASCHGRKTHEARQAREDVGAGRVQKSPREASTAPKVLPATRTKTFTLLRL